MKKDVYTYATAPLRVDSRILLELFIRTMKPSYIDTNIGEGWFSLIRRVQTGWDIVTEKECLNLQISAITRNAGTLTISATGGSPAIDNLISAAMLHSLKSCESCGGRGDFSEGDDQRVFCNPCCDEDPSEIIADLQKRLLQRDLIVDEELSCAF